MFFFSSVMTLALFPALKILDLTMMMTARLIGWQAISRNLWRGHNMVKHHIRNKTFFHLPRMTTAGIETMWTMRQNSTPKILSPGKITAMFVGQVFLK